MSGKILIIEDDHEIARLSAMYLECEGYDTKVVANGLLAVNVIKEYQPAVIILDLMLPGLPGIKVCKQARTFYSGPILVLSACDDEVSEISLLKMGADDYLTKPVQPHVLTARIAALLRRSNCQPQSLQPESLPSPTKWLTPKRMLMVNQQKQHIVFYQQQIILTEGEFELFILLFNHRGQVVSRDLCCQNLRGIDYDLSNRSIDMRISGLRKKFSAVNPSQKIIKTIRNKGYMLVDE